MIYALLQSVTCLTMPLLTQCEVMRLPEFKPAAIPTFDMSANIARMRSEEDQVAQAIGRGDCAGAERLANFYRRKDLVRSVRKACE